MKRSLAVYDRDLARAIGMNEAILFEWLWFFLHSRRIEVPNGRVIEGRRWARFSYEALHLQSDLLDSQRTLIRTVNSLEKLGLLIARQSRDGKDYAIHFARLGEVIEAEHCQQYVAESNTDGLDDWDLFFEATPKPPKQVIKTSQNGQPQTNQNGYPEPVPDTPNPVGTLTNLATQTNQNGQPPIYKESITFSTTKTTPTSVGGADAPEPLKPAKDVFTAIARIACNGLNVTTETRGAISAAIATVQNTLTAKKENLILDAHTIEDYSIWRMLLDWKGEKNGFPSIKDFETEFRFQFLAWYKSETQRQKIEFIKSQWGDWRDRLYEGDYAAFRAEVQAAFKQATPRGTQSPLSRTGRKAPEVISVDD